MAWANLTDTRCYYELLGQGEALVLIPGLGALCRADDPDALELANDFTLVCPELRGIGRSRVKRTPTTLADYCSDLVELLDHLQVERAHVMGLSLGGIIAQRFAVDHPGRVNRLVLVSCAHRFGP
ncbi:MAG: alpha/beta hydrolase, partial [Phycisphaeraceae bacterium]